jgi:hypothetical protein
MTHRDWQTVAWAAILQAGLAPSPNRSAARERSDAQRESRVGRWRGGVGKPCVLPALSVAGARVSPPAPFPPPPHRTGRANLPHPALGQGVTRLPTRGLPSLQTVAWSPDGTQLVASDMVPGDDPPSLRSVNWLVNVKTLDKSALAVPDNQLVTDWSRDGKHFLTMSLELEKSGPKMRLHLVSRDGKKDQALTDGSRPAAFGRLSPDGRKVLYLSLDPQRKAKDREGSLGLFVLDLAARHGAAGPGPAGGIPPRDRRRRRPASGDRGHGARQFGWSHYDCVGGLAAIGASGAASARRGSHHAGLTPRRSPG